MAGELEACAYLQAATSRLALVSVPSELLSPSTRNVPVLLSLLY